VNKIKKYGSDLQTFIGVNKMTSVVDGEVKKQKGTFDYDLFELKLDFSSAEIGSPTFMANIYRVCNGVCNDVYKYDFMFVVKCNSYNVFSCA
jgi:hypothetical protein